MVCNNIRLVTAARADLPESLDEFDSRAVKMAPLGKRLEN
jgi:hypothetical protein